MENRKENFYMSMMLLMASLKLAQETNELVHHLGVGHSNTISDVAYMIKEACNYKGEIRFNTNKFTGVRKRVLNVSLIFENIGWKAKTTLRDGIEKTVNWYKQQLT